MRSMISYEKVVSDIDRVRSWVEFNNIARYVRLNRSDYTEDQLDDIDYRIEKKQTYFDPQDCSILQSIILYDEHEVRLSQSEAIGECESAHSRGMSLPDYLFFSYEPLKNFEIRERQVTEYEKRLAKEIFGISEIPPAQVSPEEEEAGIVRLEVDKAGLAAEIAKLRQEHSEEAEDLRKYFSDKIKELTDQIAKLRAGVPVTKEELEKPYQHTETFDSLEYRIFTKRLATKPAKPFLLRVFREGKNEYRVVFQGKKEEIDEFLTSVEKYADEERAKRSAAAKTYVARKTPEQDYPVPCAYYKRQTGRPCNRYVAWLAGQILKTLQDDFGEKFDEQTFDWGTVDWTLGSNSAMTAEKAEEIFSAWLVSYKSLSGNRVAPSAEAVEDLTTQYLLLAQYLALIRVKERYGRTDEEELANAYRVLQKEYRMGPDTLYSDMTEADGWFRQQGSDGLEFEISREVDKIKRRLGIGE